MKFPPPHQRWRLPAYDLSTHRWFEWFIMGAVVVNTVLMASRHFGQPGEGRVRASGWRVLTALLLLFVVAAAWDSFLHTSNLFFTALFALEAAVKLVAVGRNYFKSQWNQFDFVVVIASLVGFLVPDNI
ncbi:MAG: ion transporter, partial [Acidovorax sp.]|uniref:ion transporter n=1 Tax=Acidovorax sp. TaxID=1872122 RepID=UPI00391BC53E